MFSNLSKLKQILTRREQVQLYILLCAILAMSITQALGVASVMPFIGLVMDPSMVFENRWLLWTYDLLGFSSVHSFTIFTGIMMFVIIFCSNAISAFTTWLKLKISWMNNHRLSIRLLEKYVSMPYSFFLNQNSSELSKNVLSEITNLTHYYIIPLLSLLTKGLMVLIILFMLFWVDVTITLVAIVLIGGAYLLIYWRVNKSLDYIGIRRMQADEIRYKSAYDVFGGIKEIKVLNRENLFLARYSQGSLNHSRYMSKHEVIGQLPRFALEAIAFGGIIIYTLVLLLTQDDVRQMIPMASLFAFAGYRLMPAIQEIFICIASIRFSLPILERIHNDILEGVKVDSLNVKNDDYLPEPLTFQNEIVLDNITFNYPSTRYPVIFDLNIKIRYNTSVAFVGPTGAGKTTLVDIILGLLRPQKGSLLVDGQPLNDDKIRSWQVNLGYVPQQIYLSDDTVARNIAFGVPDDELDLKALENASTMANIDEFIMNELPDGYDTMIGERGIRLSGGQRQRIGIARALYHDPAVLIFDEATSSLDGITEEAILKALQNVSKSKTLIIIAHRLTTVKNCDIVYMIDKGKIVGSGTYEQLLKSSKHFKAMAKVR